MMGTMLEEILYNDPAVILDDDLLEDLVSQGCSRPQGEVGNIIDKCVVNNVIFLEG